MSCWAAVNMAENDDIRLLYTGRETLYSSQILPMSMCDFLRKVQSSQRLRAKSNFQSMINVHKVSCTCRFIWIAGKLFAQRNSFPCVPKIMLVQSFEIAMLSIIIEYRSLSPPMSHVYLGLTGVHEKDTTMAFSDRRHQVVGSILIYHSWPRKHDGVLLTGYKNVYIYRREYPSSLQ